MTETKTLYLIRHGKTRGNLEKRYVGRTDEGLLAAERERLTALYSDMDIKGLVCHLVSSPMKRCLETAAVLFPDLKPFTADGLREMDFGDFEYKNYEELKDNAAYQAYLDSMGRSSFPNAETLEAFSSRVCKAFEKMAYTLEDGTALVVHGGTIMALLSAYGEPGRDYFDYMVKNGEGWQVSCRTDREKQLIVMDLIRKLP